MGETHVYNRSKVVESFESLGKKAFFLDDGENGRMHSLIEGVSNRLGSVAPASILPEEFGMTYTEVAEELGFSDDERSKYFQKYSEFFDDGVISRVASSAGMCGMIVG